MSILLEACQISKYFAARKIFAFDGVKIYSGDKIGVVGANGSGKSTLLNILAKKLLPDSGYVRHFCDISYIRQFGDVETEKVSGGERTRLEIAGALKGQDALIFADEPTTNLDWQGVQWVTKILLQAESILIVSHDRNLLDTVCNRIIAVEDGELSFYHGNFSTYLEQRRRKQEYAQSTYEHYMGEKKRLEESVQQIKQKANRMKSAPKRMGNSEARLHKGGIKDRRKKFDQSSRAMEGRLAHMEAQERPEKERRVILDFSLTNPPANKIVIKGEQLTFSYPDKPRLFLNSQFFIPNGSKTCFYGPNGCGKTTLLNMIASGAPGITVAPKVRLGYFYQEFENLSLEKTMLENAMRDSVQPESTVRTILARLLFRREDTEKKVKALSGGERVKLSLCKLFVSDANVLLLDEPTNYLDIPSIEVLQQILADYPGTVILVSHDRTLVRAVADRFILFHNDDLLFFEGSLDQLPKYR